MTAISRRAAMIGLGTSGMALTAPVVLRTQQASNGDGPVTAGLVQVMPGRRRIDRPITVSGYGTLVLSGGGSAVAGTGRAGSLIVGGGARQASQWFQPVRGVARRGDNVLAPASVDGYREGQMVLVLGGRSQNSSPGNPIAKTRQFLTIVAVDQVQGSLRFSTPLESDLSASDHAAISRPDAPVTVASTIQNLQIGAIEASAVVYTHSIELAYVVSVRDMIISGDAASGFVAHSDHVVYDNVAFSGYSGISCARGTRRVSWRDCSYTPRAKGAEGYCAFLEESPESVLVDNFRARGGQFKITSMSDDDVYKAILVRDLDLDFDGTGVRDNRVVQVPAIEIAFAASGTSMVRFERGTVRTPGGTYLFSDREIPRCAVFVHASRNVLLSGLRFAGLRPDAYAIAVDGTNCFGLEIDDCMIVDGSGKGLCHPSVLANLGSDANGSTLKRMDRLEIGLSQGRVLVSWRPEIGEMLCEWPRGPARRVGRFAADGQRHRIVLDIVVGQAGGRSFLRSEVDIGDDVREADTGRAVPSGFPLRVMRNGKENEVVIAPSQGASWQGRIQYLMPDPGDGQRFSLS